ncbi:PRC-barrel domain-containing protein [Salegentibacter salinarum]|uniref:PRC-barrel domain-containing protein n=1 Tax=Salegentibacter salinarum TaxID=447422 RepID=UPI0009CC865E|nr:PRC-barrel domain-containing protein [Salegentibacter salinarum]SKB80176.1 PRC-barrel domain-containing protein [Salegentibacter salinarum]
MASNNNNNRNKDKHLFYLNELSDYKVSSDDPDVRGWKVKDVDQRIIGKVDNLLVNKNTERVVYLDVEVDKSILEANHDPYRSSASEGVHEFVNKDGEEHLIIPIGLVKLNEDDKFIYTDKVNHRTFAETKRKRKAANIDREYEEVVLASYNRGAISSEDKPRDDRSQAEFNDDTATKIREDRETELRDSDVSHNDPTHKKTGERGEIKDDFNPKNTQKTSFKSNKEKGSSQSTSQSQTDAASGRRDHKDDEDFYNKKEFDDKNFRKRK